MKKLLFLLSLICLTAGCSTEPAPPTESVWIPAKTTYYADGSYKYTPGYWIYPQYAVSPIRAFVGVRLHFR